jgi:hypothetical protein
VKIGKQMVAMVCCVCVHKDETLDNLRGSCAQCLMGNKKFKLDSKYARSITEISKPKENKDETD